MLLYEYNTVNEIPNACKEGYFPNIKLKYLMGGSFAECCEEL